MKRGTTTPTTALRRNELDRRLGDSLNNTVGRYPRAPWVSRSMKRRGEACMTTVPRPTSGVSAYDSAPAPVFDTVAAALRDGVPQAHVIRRTVHAPTSRLLHTVADVNSRERVSAS